jgi:ureidoglycolate hydrolase
VNAKLISSAAEKHHRYFRCVLHLCILAVNADATFFCLEAQCGAANNEELHNLRTSAIGDQIKGNEVGEYVVNMGATMKMEEVRSSETLVHNQKAQFVQHMSAAAQEPTK